MNYNKMILAVIKEFIIVKIRKFMKKKFNMKQMNKNKLNQKLKKKG